MSAPSPNERWGVFATGIRRDMSEKGWVPIRYWILWWASIATAVVFFFLVMSPVWLGLRAAAWLADLRSRARNRR